MLESRRWHAYALLALAVLLAACSGSDDEALGDPTSTSETRSTLPESTSSTSSVAATTPSSDAGSAIATPPIAERLRTGALLGMSTGLTRAERQPRWAELEELAGRTYDIGHVFHSWDTPIPTEDDLMHLADGRVLMISWNGTDTREIAAGAHDDWIRSQAQAVRDLGEPVMLRWLWEMDGQRRRDWVHSGADYVAAWNHVRDLFATVGADNAEFVWCPNEALFWNGGDPMPWYPGDDQVDWLCADGYNWGTSSTAADWLSFDQIFGDFYRWAAPRGLPIIIGETGVGEAEPEAKAQWLRALPDMLRTQFPEIDAVVYFDKDFTFQGHRDWRVDTSASSLEAWLAISADPWFN
ncbi:MAG: hypothetical protein R2770_15685 [Acidimicrobiales bacterium]